MGVSVQTYTVATKNVVHQAMADLIDSGSGAGLVKFRDESGVLLATVPLAKPCGSVNITSGRLTFAMAGRDDFIDVSGMLDHVDVTDSSGNIYLQLPAVEGLVPVPGKIVVDKLALTAGKALELDSLVVV